VAETTSYSTGTRYGDVAITPSTMPRSADPPHRVVRDVTEQKRMEGEVRQLQKLEAIGRRRRIAHGLHNILRCDHRRWQHAAQDVQDNRQAEPGRRDRQSRRARGESYAPVLAFGAAEVLQPQVLDLNGVVRNLETMLGGSSARTSR